MRNQNTEIPRCQRELGSGEGSLPSTHLGDWVLGNKQTSQLPPPPCGYTVTILYPHHELLLYTRPVLKAASTDFLLNMPRNWAFLYTTLLACKMCEKNHSNKTKLRRERFSTLYWKGRNVYWWSNVSLSFWGGPGRETGHTMTANARRDRKLPQEIRPPPPPPYPTRGRRPVQPPKPRAKGLQLSPWSGVGG